MTWSWHATIEIAIGLVFVVIGVIILYYLPY